VKAIVTPVLIGGASLAGRRFGHHVGGWLVGLPLTSGPVAFFLATDHGMSFAGGAAVGMLAGTISRVAFALAYRSSARRGATRAWLVGCVAFIAATIMLSFLHWPAPETFALVLATLIVGYAVTARDGPGPSPTPCSSPARADAPRRRASCFRGRHSCRDHGAVRQHAGDPTRSTANRSLRPEPSSVR
jgi:hypothetical protein